MRLLEGTTCLANSAYFGDLPRLAKNNPDATTSQQSACRPEIRNSEGYA